ncbi:hypothetical protein QUF80_21980 [Desulfococcaceae bacterium HSG8]|nr:hypothetical protein [Desulfococcaceae bacterium HSG8]
MENLLREWLEHPDTQRMLSDVARSVMRHAISRQLSFMQDNKIYSENHEVWKDIRSELVLFILENELRIRKMLLLSGLPGGHHRLRKAFINYWIGKTRRPLKDPQRYLYKHAADVLRLSDNFYISAKSNSSAFSMSAEAVPIPPLSAEDIRDIPFPDQITQKLDYESVNKKKVLLMLAAHFWEKVSEMWGKPVRADLRDFIRWIGLHVPVRFLAPVRSLPDGRNISEFIPDHCQKTEDIYFDQELVKKWARNFANRLSENEKTAFVLRYGLRLSLKEIAIKMGYKGSSGPKYPLKHAEQKLRFFLCDLPWLSPDDLNEEAFSLFHDTLLLLLKETNRKEYNVQPKISTVPG